MSSKINGCATSIGTFILTLVIVGVIVLILAWPAMALWNALIPVLFKGPVVTYWQMVGLNLLSTLLLKSGTTSVNNNK